MERASKMQSSYLYDQ
ncbi:hypothetical protein ACSK4A_000389 [Escherichia coli]|nr:hypothetical protein [Escherichia coli]